MAAEETLALTSRATSEKPNKINATCVLGVPVSMINIQNAVAMIIAWAKDGKANYVCIRDVHGIILAQNNAELLAIHESAGLVTPDGMPLVWICRHRGGKSLGRVCGADLVDALCAASLTLGLRHYFYGGKPGVAQEMAAVLSVRYPGLRTVGSLCPPFRSLSKDEDDAIVREITESAPHIVWVGLSTPKQEFWMRDHVGRIPGATIIGVGAAFDFHAGKIARAPKWMQRAGLEWSHRLYTEPRRLWRRYLVTISSFLWLVIFRRKGRG